MCREEEIQAAGVLSEREAAAVSVSVAKSDVIRDKAQPGTQQTILDTFSTVLGIT